MRPKPPPAIRVSGGRNTRFADVGSRCGQACSASFRARRVSGITPELSRTALRPRRWLNLRAISAAAKRSRLERIVKQCPAVSWQRANSGQPGLFCRVSGSRHIGAEHNKCRTHNYPQRRKRGCEDQCVQPDSNKKSSKQSREEPVGAPGVEGRAFSLILHGIA